MVAPVNPIQDEMMIKLREARSYSEKVDTMVSQGKMDRRFGDYTQQLIMLDFLAEEAEVFTGHGLYDRAMNSLTQMKFKLDSVAGVLLADGELQTEKMGHFSVIKNPNFNNMEKYQGLFDFAHQKYEDAVDKFSKTLEAAA